MESREIDANEVAQMLGVTAQTVRAWANDKNMNFPCTKTSRVGVRYAKYCFDRDEIRRWAEQNIKKTTVRLAEGPQGL